jgi:hypothetical protein
MPEIIMVTIMRAEKKSDDTAFRGLFGSARKHVVQTPSIHLWPTEPVFAHEMRS